MLPFAFMSPGPLEIIVILLVVLLLFGAKRLPDLARSLGKSLSEFKKGREEGALPEKAEKPETAEKTDTADKTGGV